MAAASVMSTDQVAAARARGVLGATGSNRLFGGLKSDLYGDTDFDGRMATVHAGDVVLTRLEANRHRVMRSPSLVRAVGGRLPEDRGALRRLRRRRAEGPRGLGHARPVEHLRHHRQLRGGQPGARGAPDRDAAQGAAGRARPGARPADGAPPRRHAAAWRALALETMRTAYRELPGMSETAARGVGDAITQFVHLSMLDLAGIGTAMTQREALRERIKQHVTRPPGRPASCRSTASRTRSTAAGATCTTPSPTSPTAWPATSCAGAWRPAARTFGDRRAARTARSPTSRSSFGFSNMAHFSRVFRTPPGPAAERLPPRRARVGGVSQRT